MIDTFLEVVIQSAAGEELRLSFGADVVAIP